MESMVNQLCQNFQVKIERNKFRKLKKILFFLLQEKLKQNHQPVQRVF